MKPPIFRGYVPWHGEENSPQNSFNNIRAWLLVRLPFEIIKPCSEIDLRDIGNSVEDKWSVFRDGYGDSHYFFETETDVMAFKLRWM